MTTAATSLLVDALVELLGDLLALQDSLDAALRRKLDALRRHDAVALRTADDEERPLSNDIARLDNHRRSVLARYRRDGCNATDPAGPRLGGAPHGLRLLTHSLPESVR